MLVLLLFAQLVSGGDFTGKVVAVKDGPINLDKSVHRERIKKSCLESG